MATGNILSIWNRSLGSIGARSQVQSQNEGSPESIACNTFFQSTFEAMARTAWWNCLSKQAPLSLVSAAPGTMENPKGALTPYPPNPWAYSYLVPPDSLRIRKMVPPPAMLQGTGGVPIFPINNALYAYNGQRRIIPFEVTYGIDTNGNPAETILTNLRGAQAIYTVNQSNPAYWDSLFQQAMVNALAVYLVPALSLDKALMQMKRQDAEAIITQARAADGNEGTVSQQREASWIAARNGSSGLQGWLGYNGPNLNYENMPWGF